MSEYRLSPEAREAFRALCNAYQDEIKAKRLRDGCTYPVVETLYGPRLCKAPVMSAHTDYCAEHHPIVQAELERRRTDPEWQALLAQLHKENARE